MRLTSSDDEDDDEDDYEDEREEGLHSTGLSQTLISRYARIQFIGSQNICVHFGWIEIDKATMRTAHRAHTEVIDPKITCDKCLLQILAIWQLEHIPSHALCGHIAAFPT